jgi:hypothetical protein
MKSMWVTALLVAIACGRQKDPMEIAGELRAATASAIESGTLAEAEAAFATLEQFRRKHSLSSDLGMVKMLARDALGAHLRSGGARELVFAGREHGVVARSRVAARWEPEHAARRIAIGMPVVRALTDEA